MAESPTQVAGAIEGSEPTQGAAGGQELQPYAAGGSELQSRSPGTTVGQQQGAENDEIQTQFHFHMSPIFIFPVSINLPTQGNQVGPTGEVDIPTDEVIREMSEIKLDNDIEKLVKQGFEALIQDDDSENSTLDFIKSYEEEDESIPSEYYKGRKQLKEFMGKAWEDTHLQLVSTTCDRHLADDIELKRVLAQFCANLSSKLREQNKYESYLMKFVPRAEDIYNLGKDFATKKKVIHAVTSFHTAAKLIKMRKNGDRSVNGIRNCSFQTILVVQEMAAQEPMRRITLHHVIPMMRERMNSIRSIQDATHSVRIGCEAWCLHYTGLCYYFCGEYQQFANENESAIKLLETEFKEKARKYRVYGASLNCVAGADFCMQNFSKAIKLLPQVLEAYEHAEDWESEGQKNLYIEHGKYYLEKSKNQERIRLATITSIAHNMYQKLQTQNHGVRNKN